MYPTLDLEKITFDPYPYQVEAVNKIIEWGMKDNQSQVNTLVSLIQSGKTFCCCAAIGELYKQGKRIWIIVDSIELLGQWWEAFFELNPDIPRRDCWYIGNKKTEMLHKQIQFVQVQTLDRRFKRFKDKIGIKPDLVFIDESHEVANYKVINDLVNHWHPKQINVTATPVFHGKSKVQYVDVFPAWEFPNEKNPLRGTGDMLWHIGANSKMMLDLKRWKKPTWLIGSDTLSQITADRFKGMKIRGSEYDETSQAHVMIDLIPEHIAEWKDNQGNKRSTIWFCVNQLHCLEMVKALIKEGRKVALVLSKLTLQAQKELTDLGVIFDRKEAIRKYKTGELTDLVNCQCLTTGFSAAIGSCAVWARRTMSVGLFCQMSGRVLTYHPDFDTALLMDFAGNLGVHGIFPENIDWLDFNPSKLMFKDPNQVVCRKCGYRHDSTPKPHHIDKHVKFSVKLGQFVYPKDFTGIKEKLGFEQPINCNGCNNPVYFHTENLNLYSTWISSVRASMMFGEKPDKFKGSSAGISIGVPTKDCQELLTIGDMYECNLWSLIEEEKDDDGNVINSHIAEDNGPKDNSEAYMKIRDKQLEALKGKSLRAKKLSKLTLVQREYVESHDVKKLLEVTDRDGKYRAAIAYMYLSDKSPLTAWQYWSDTELANPPKTLVKQALTGLYNGDDESYQMLKTWIHGHYEDQSNHAKKGVLLGFLKTLAEIK